MAAKILEEWLEKVGVTYERIRHPRRETALETACAEGEDPAHVAKVVVVESRSKHVMFVLSSDRRLDLFKAAEACNDKGVRVVFESEMVDDFPDSQAGAEPPFGRLYGLPTFLDASLTVHPQIVFNAGTHTESFKMDTNEYIDLEVPQIGDYSTEDTKAIKR